MTWKLAADDALDRADHCLRALDLEGAWSAVNVARRFEVFGLAPEELQDARIALLEESQSGKLGTWRKEAIENRMKDLAKPVLPEELADALAIRDEATDTQYYKIAITGQQINVLLRICFLAGMLYLGVLWLSRYTFTHAFGCGEAWNVRKLASVLLLGLFGAALSTLRGLITTDTWRRVPDWIANRSITIGRLLSGVIAGLAGYIFWVEGVIPFDKDAKNWQFSVPFIFGYLGERLVMKFAGSLSKDDAQSGSKDKKA